MHRCDKASPLLAKNAASDKNVARAVLSARKAGEGQKDFLKVTLKKVSISSVTASTAEPDGDPVEAVAMSCRTIEFAHSPQTSKGSLGTPVQFNWDIAAGKVG